MLRCGVLNVNKPIDISSAGLIDFIKSIIKNKSVKIGHTGTLDPIATGVLLLTFGPATKISQCLTNCSKVYSAEMKLGISTDSCDRLGNVTKVKEVNCDLDKMIDVCKHFTGSIEQTVPIYSAVKKNGKRLYELARNGVSVDQLAFDLPRRNVTIKQLLVNNFNSPFCDITVHCSSGTYIRSLIDDIGNKLECGAHMTKLERTSVANFSIKDSLTISKELTADDIFSQLIPVGDALSFYPKLVLNSTLLERLVNTHKIYIPELNVDPASNPLPYFQFFAEDGTFIGIGKTTNTAHCNIIYLCPTAKIKM